jgi:hypothetical protein
LSFNARANYRLPLATEPWRFYLGAGGYYSTTFVQQNSFGYQNVGGPSVLATVKRVLKDGSSMILVGKLSAVAPGFSLLGLSNREWAASLSYIMPVRKTHFWNFSLDLSNLQLFDVQGIPVNSNMGTLSVGYGF